MLITAVIPAHNESGRVGAVVAAVLASRALDRVLVVDDGSTDATAREARAAGAEVIVLSPNRGKGGAMLEGVMRAQADAVLFLDADLIGFLPEHVSALVEPVRNGDAEMVCGLRDYGPTWNALQVGLPPITGERCVRVEVLRRVHDDDWSGWRIEAGINEACRRAGARIALAPLHGMTIYPKWHKVGAQEGFREAAVMARSVLTAMTEARARVDQPPSGRFSAEAIVPAHNESGRVGAVVRTLKRCPSLSRVLVVDDGSADATAQEAREAGAEVMTLSPNRGKGGAMLAALARTTAPWVGFFDADLIGLTPEHVEEMAAEARGGQYGMVTGTWVQHSHPPWTEIYALYGFDLSGQRFVHRSVIDRLPERYWSGYGIEVALDEATARCGYAQRRLLLEGMKITTQREKLGAAEGFMKTTRILTEALRAAGKVRTEEW